jgi:hypothetical protein
MHLVREWLTPRLEPTLPRSELWAIGRQRDRLHAIRPGDAAARVGAAVIQHHGHVLGGECLSPFVQEHLKACTIEPREKQTEQTSSRFHGSVPCSVKAIGDKLSRQSPPHNVLTSLVRASMVCRRSHGHQCVPAGDSTPTMLRPPSSRMPQTQEIVTRGAADASHGGGTDRPRVDLARGTAVSGAAMAAATGTVCGGYGWGS